VSNSKPLDEETVKVSVVDEAGEALKREAEKAFRNFEFSGEAKGYKAGFLGAVVFHVPRIKESLVVLKLQAEKKPGDDTEAYAAFMLTHKDSTPASQLFPLGYHIEHTLTDLEMFIANVEFDLQALDLGMNAMSGMA
jgi:hypothetical protein